MSTRFDHIFDELEKDAAGVIEKHSENVKEDLREVFRERYKEYVLENVSARNEVKDLVYGLALQFSIDAIEATQNRPEQFERKMEQLRARLEEDIMDGIEKIL